MGCNISYRALCASRLLCSLYVLALMLAIVLKIEIAIANYTYIFNGGVKYLVLGDILAFCNFAEIGIIK